MTLTIRRATRDDVEAVHALVTDAARWLAERGSDQWQYSVERHRLAIERAIGRGELWVVDDDAGATIATITLNEYADPDFWIANDDPDDALYVHRMAVAREASGQEIGSAMLDWAARQAVDTGRKWLRLDAWATNTALHDYYRRRGFESVRLLRFQHRGSGALFQRPSGTQFGTGLRLIDNTALRR
jgi:ribosomal protein S18 acetylase RimI-like enzyme